MANQQFEQAMQDRLQIAALLRIVAHGFAYPVADTAARMVQALEDAWERLGEDRCALAPALELAHSAWRDANLAALRAEYARLFIGGDAVSLHETAYGDGRRIAGRPVELADIGGFYLAFGLEISEQAPDLPDHLCAELEYYSLLLVKQTYAQSSGWVEEAEVTAHAARQFLEQHLGRWVHALALCLAEREVRAPYREHVRLLETLIDLECSRESIRPAPLEGRLPSDFMQADAFECPHGQSAPSAGATERENGGRSASSTRLSVSDSPPREREESDAYPGGVRAGRRHRTVVDGVE